MLSLNKALKFQSSYIYVINIFRDQHTYMHDSYNKHFT